ncbi:MAG: HypC/HybG/HupF family hydrogenase formation chaperone [Lachnospiraceae bacterium]|nr:HypC/HybG/HupF family hydrogenase formation chaperone [Lachnospiraceae bacterium]
MCVALPGKVVSVKGRKAAVDFSGNIVEADAGLADVEVDDRVLVHAGCIIQKLSKEDADFMTEFADYIRELEG